MAMDELGPSCSDQQSSPPNPASVVNDGMTSSSPSSSPQRHSASATASVSGGTRYENQKRRDWNSFGKYLRDHHRPPLDPSRCSGAHVVEFLCYLDQFGKTKVLILVLWKNSMLFIMP